ncbi:protein phosphatase 2C domain-containing protein [Dictyobacter aurantiacus]|uniref:PPM-type phosphatase domain-containing protein n=1 Tax=Dictyobacter aurantiacus TaxID=1936993 RepID=A0A401ZI87_9CHLR|nr:protein phosphatase 2C domain-containing protein [Dictyobacter aurantiacus]GCE06553.1 hypothetical protein KDAU_38820 [Dictyobacter aurantiacus]
MPSKHAEDAFRILESDQIIDSFTRAELASSTIARLLSFRCREAREQALPNQDYARISYRKDGSSLSFCVSDGVSSSYKGDFAACCLAAYLVKWLQELPAEAARHERLDAALRTQLDRLAVQAQQQLQRLEMEPGTPGLVREVLEDLRQNYGSETVFFCGRLDYEMSIDRQRAQLKSAFFCWMGNVTARLFLNEQQYILLGEKTDKNGRWSTRHGCRGELHTWSRSLSTLERLIVHTDGLDAIGETLSTLDDDAWLAEVQRLLASSDSDDMTVFDLSWLPAEDAEGTWR